MIQHQGTKILRRPGRGDEPPTTLQPKKEPIPLASWAQFWLVLLLFGDLVSWWSFMLRYLF